jgi:hypothetical protein
MQHHARLRQNIAHAIPDGKGYCVSAK